MKKLDFWTNLLIFLTFLGGVAYSFYLGEQTYFYDEKEYVILASNLAEKGMFSMDGMIPTAWRPPGYAFFLAPFVWMGASLTVLRILNFAALALSMYLVKVILERDGAWTSLLGVLLMLFYPVFFYTAGTLYPQTIATTLLLLSIWLLFKEERSKLSFLLLGLVQGFLLLSIPTFLCSLSFFGLWTFFREKVSKFLFFALGVLLVVAPWTARNSLLFKEFVFVSTNGGINLLLGNSPFTTPDSGVNVDLSGYRDPKSFGNEVEADQYFQGEAVRYMRNHPIESGKLYVKKLLHYFHYENDFATKHDHPRWQTWLLLFTYNFLLAVAVVRFLDATRFPLQPLDWFCLLLYLVAGICMAVFFTRIRFRLPFDSLLVLLNARFLAALFQRLFVRLPK